MLSFATYKIAHVFGILLALVALAGMSVHAANGGTAATNTVRRAVSIMHGIGLLIILISGFGLLARLGMASSFGGWVWIKLTLWLVIGGLIALPYRRPQLAPHVLIALPILGGFAAYLAISKPF